MPDSVIQQVEDFGLRDNIPGDFDFTDRQGILFEWNNSIIESDEPLLDNSEPFPAIPTELPGVALAGNQPLAAVEAAFLPQGYAKTAAANNANLQPFNATIAGVPLPPVIDEYDGDDDNGDANAFGNADDHMQTT